MLWSFDTKFSIGCSVMLDTFYLIGLALFCLAVIHAWRNNGLSCASMLGLGWVMVIFAFSYRFLVIVSVLGSLYSLKTATIALTRCVLHTLLLPVLLTVGTLIFLSVVSMRSTKLSRSNIVLRIISCVLVVLISIWLSWVMYKLWQLYGAYPVGKAYLP